MNVAAFVAAVVVLSQVHPTPARAGAPDTVSRQLIARFSSTTAASHASSAAARAGGLVTRRLGSIDAVVVRPRHGIALAALRRALERRRDVRYVEPDVILTKSVTPDDPDLLRQYALGDGTGSISAREAWDKRTSCAKVATLDSGVEYAHPDLKANIWHNPHEIAGNDKDDDHNGYVDDYYGVNIPKGRDSATDDDGHGTHVAGIIGGRTNNATGIAGTCWTTTIVPVRFMDSRGRGSTSDAIAGMQYAAHAGAKVINCSFGAPTASKALHDEIEDVKGKGVLVVVAAGNDGKDLASDPSYPASYADGNIISVAATTADDTLASFSNFDAKGVDLAAPGDSILSTYPTDRYKVLSGTSMAAPFVTAAAAMLRAKDPKASYSEIRQRLLSSVDHLQSLQGKVSSGGRLDLHRALDEGS
ncbi:Thermophilic serine proteinase [Baekduia alba]|uniref:S8 family peptidase n=1 Tax=Baekduia alba TaxID=2997333 RepID=UPI00233FBD75|nr:S8 family peptidase [Baekduia alba]WCB93662.1 Thermophilic serine proteinase [Baekduia alba]